MLPTSNLSPSSFQIDWPAPQDKKRECVAKGKNNQVTWFLADSIVVVTAMLNSTMAVFFKTLVYESSTPHFTLLNYIMSSNSGFLNWKLSSHYISEQRVS